MKAFKEARRMVGLNRKNTRKRQSPRLPDNKF